MSDAPRYFLSTLGCKVNQYESRCLSEAFEGLGLAPAADPAGAGLIVVNTCAVTAAAEAQGRRLTARLARLAAPGARVVVTGCAAAARPATFAGIPGLVLMPDKAALARTPLAPPAPAQAFPPPYPDLGLSGSDRARAMVKIQDGCSRRCAYCIVPLARGPARSRPAADILAETERLLAAGHGEIVLTGVDIGQFVPDPWELLQSLEAALVPKYAGEIRLRLSSLYPEALTEKALAVLGGSRLICPHLHLSLQSADPDVLAAMGRDPDSPARLRQRLAELAAAWPVMGLTADILTGFPGETETAHQATLAFLEALPLTKAHVFAYSPRPGTRAAKSAAQVPAAEKKCRAEALRRLAAEKETAFVARLAAEGRTVAVAVEDGGPERGKNEYYVSCRFTDAPDGREIRPGRIVPARPVGRQGATLLVARP